MKFWQRSKRYRLPKDERLLELAKNALQLCPAAMTEYQRNVMLLLQVRLGQRSWQEIEEEAL